MIRIFTVLFLVTRALAGPIGSVTYGSSSGVSRGATATSDSSVRAYDSGRLGASKFSANYAAAPDGPATPAATKVTALYGSSQAAANGTSTYNAASAGPKAPSGYGGFPIIGTFAAPVNRYATTDPALPDFFAGYAASPPYGAVPPVPFTSYGTAPAVTSFDAGYANGPAVAKFDTSYVNAQAVPRFDASYSNGASVPKYDTSYANTAAAAKFDTSYANYPTGTKFDERTSYAATPAAAAAARASFSGLAGSPAVTKFAPSSAAAPALGSATHTSPASTSSTGQAPNNVIGARLAATGPNGKPVIEPVYASPVAAPDVSNVQAVPVFVDPGFPQGFPAFGVYPDAPAYYGYGVGDLGYGVGNYEYGHGLIGYGLNYGYGLGTPLEYSALLRKKKKCAYETFTSLNLPEIVLEE